MYSLQIRGEIIQIVKDAPVRDIITVISTAQLVNEVVLVEEEVTEQLNANASDMYKNITNAYLSVWKTATSEEVEHVSSLLLSGYGHVMRHNNQKDEDGNLASHGNGAGRKQAKLNDTIIIFKNIDVLVDVLLEFQVPDQPAITLNTTFMSVSVMKRLPKSITSINLEQSRMIAGRVVTGNITLPDSISYLPDFREKSDFELKVLFLDENPYIVDDNNAAITSTVIGISVKDRRGSIIDIKEAENETIIQIPNLNAAFLPKSENKTFLINLTSGKVALSKASLNMLLFNFSLEENKTCILKVSPGNEDVKLKLLLQRGRYPTLEEVVSDGVGFPQDPSLLASNGNFQQDEYTLLLNYIYSKNENSSFSRSQRSLDNDGHCTDSLDDKCANQSSLVYLNTFYVGITLDLDKINITEVFDISPKDTCTEGNCDVNASVSLDIEIILAATSCILWDEKALKWKSDTCKVLPYTTADMIHCACRKLPLQNLNLFAGSLTAKHFRFFVAPNEIDPIKDIYLFLTVVENPVVVTSVVLVWITYFSLLYWARRTDRLNKEKIGVMACKDNHPSHQYMYVVCVVTGWWMRAGTTANVYMYMSGLAGISPVYCLSRTRRKCFQSGAEDWILVTTKRSLGVLKSVTVWHDNTGQSPEWYLTQIVIKDVQTQKHWTFLYSDWLAVDRGVLITTTTTLEPVSQEDMKKHTKQNFIITSSNEMRNSHLWISIFSKTTRDSFTHVQRLTCALSLLLSNMLANIMFFGIPTDQPEHQLNVTKGITVSLSSILIGIESSLIIFPINTLILQFFTNLKPKPKSLPKSPQYLQNSGFFKTEEQKEKQDETISAQTLLECEEISLETFKHEEYQQNIPTCSLPWWFVYIGWSLAITTSLIASFFVMLYGLKFGYEKSLNWLVSFFTAFTNSTCVIQPVKVLFIAALLTLILKRTVQFEDFGPGQQLEKDEEYIEETLVGKKRKRYKKQKPLSQKMIAVIRKRIWVQWLLNTTLQDMVLYSIFLAVVLIVVHGHRNITVSFQCTKTVENAFINRGRAKERGLSEVSDVKSILWYLDEVLLPKLAKLNQPNSLNSLASFCLVGTARLRQIRVNKGPCDKRIRSYFHNVSLHDCVAEYTMGNEDTRNYNGSWLYPIKDGFPGNSNRWTYQTSLKLKTLPFSGLHAIYSGGGFVTELPPHVSDQEAMLKTIKESDWIDDGTKGLFVEFTLYNPNVNMFSVVILLFEFTNVGRVFPFHKVFTTKLYHYTNGFEVFVAVCEVAFLIFTIGLTIVESKRLRQLGRKKYLDDIWNVVQILQITLSYSIIGVFFQRMVIIKFIMNEFTTSRGKKFINFYSAVTWDIILGYMSAFLVLIMIIKVLKLLRFSKRFFMLIDTLSVARTQLLHFGIVLLVLFLSFGLFAVLAFGKEENEFRHVWTCLMYLINFSLAMSEFSNILELHWILGPVFFCSFIVIIQWCFLTMFVAILNISIHKSKKNLKKKRNKFLLIQYMKRKWMENISKRFACCR
ncbi:hypothetical protein CHS0354_041902 [Potamilus streckersoni]|uniref:PLAT domain-containing protein n=1 Tax=Potamilus streckersoni TaxID=2493646 RepID=A0AAE0W115_9BIVA|nr:hypothetical protein CHS0354_041902 [Potamilus streckersoni]